jgi:uncharacterized membrane protein YphA (DoxX/SURF4 family)
VQRSFSTFPGGWPGASLLLLRATVGLAAVIQGGYFLADRNNQTLVIWAAGPIAIASGALLLIGFLTPVAGVLIALGSAGIALSWVPTSIPNLLDARLSATLVAIIAAAIVFLGPGAFSLDSRLFGRREIIIPPPSRSPES